MLSAADRPYPDSPIAPPLLSEARLKEISGLPNWTMPSKALAIEALQALAQNRMDLAHRDVASARDSLLSKVYYWFLYSSGKGDIPFERLAEFLIHNPDWPLQFKIRKRAEELLPADLSDTDLVAWFDQFPPMASENMERYLTALKRTGHNKKARDLLLDWWKTADLTPEEQGRFLETHADSLDKARNEDRLDRLLLTGRYTSAMALARKLGKNHVLLAEARIALAKNKDGVNALIAGVPKALQSDAGLAYERLRWRRRHDLDDRAIEILFAPPPATSIHNPADWWQERHILIRRLLEKRDWKTAYRLAKGHIQTDGFPYAQAEWMCGWLALRFVNAPEEAFAHFVRMYNSVETPISRSRGAYWAGRSAEALKKPGAAQEWYSLAAQHGTTFYGQLAAAKLGQTDALASIVSAPSLTEQGFARMENNERAQAARLLHLAGLNEASGLFMLSLAEGTPQIEDFYRASFLASALGRHYDAVQISKKASWKQMVFTRYAYPTIRDVVGEDKTGGLDPALVHGLIRQESSFDRAASSPAGAKGLMQLMPGTAKDVARSLNINYRKDWLTSKPEHNITLGTTYLRKMLDRYDGSYVLAVAAYNAGPRRVDGWIRLFGDPRKSSVDSVDWVEMIPVYETRNYVQRVLENTYVYRRLLEDTPSVEKAALETRGLYVAMHTD